MKSLGDIYKIRKCDVENYLGKKWKNSNCPMCGEFKWGLFTPSYENDDSEKMTYTIDQNYLCDNGVRYFNPTVLITCKNCGNTLYINLKLSGLLD